MSDLSNLYISQSYKGLINLADSTKGITGQTDYELQDGLGQGVGVSILSGSVLVENEISSSTVNGIGNVTQYSASVDLRLDELEATASDHDPRVDALEEYTSSLRDAFTVSGSNTTFKGDINISGSITAYELFVTTESASVIFSSGSNTLGDEPSDVQIFSGSVYVPNLHYLAGNPIDTNLRINQKLDTGSFLIFSASVESQLEQIVQDALPSSWTGSVFLPFSSSVSQQLTALNNFSESILQDTASFAAWTGSVFAPFSASVDSRLDSAESSIINLEAQTGSYAVTSSNIFTGPSNTFSGSVIVDSANLSSNPLEIRSNKQTVLTVNDNLPSGSDVNVEINDYLLVKGDVPKVTVEKQVGLKSRFTNLTHAELEVRGGNSILSFLTASYGRYTQFRQANEFDIYLGQWEQMSSSLSSMMDGVEVSGLVYGKESNQASGRNVISILNPYGFGTNNIQIGNFADTINISGSELLIRPNTSIEQNLTVTGSLSVYTSASIDGGWHVTGSSYYTGSVRGNVHYVSSSTSNPSDYTHSIDCSLGNFHDFYLKEGENLITTANIQGGETITVRLNQPSGSQTGSYGSVTWDTGSIKFPFTSNPQTTQGSEAIDVLTLVSFDTGALFGVLGKNYL
jgi:hypothetical protein